MGDNNGGVSWRLDYDDEVETDGDYWRLSKTALLAVIDARPNMFTKWESNQESPFIASLKCCLSICRSKIISSPSDYFGILLNGSSATKNPTSFPNLFLLHPLASLKVEIIENLQNLINSPTIEDFETKIGSSENYDLKDLFWLSRILFEDAKTGNFVKKILYFTCEDEPHRGKINLQNDAVQKFKDIGSVDLSIVTFRSDFNILKFYHKISVNEENVLYPSDIPSLLKIIRIKQRSRRAICKTSLFLAPALKISVGIYSLVRQAQKPKKHVINQRNNEPVQEVVTKFRNDDVSANLILKSEEVRLAQVGGQQIIFQNDELKKLKTMSETGIKIMGYLPVENFKLFSWFRSDSYFMYPDEERTNGSTALFTTLLKRCHLLQKVALCKLMLNRSRTPKIAFLIPSIPEPSDLKLGQAQPSGFYVFLIPFSDEMRNLPEDSSLVPQIPPEIVEICEKIVRKTTTKNFDLQHVGNPELQLKWRQIEKLALDQEDFETEEFKDFTIPNYDMMEERIGELSKIFSEKSALAAPTFQKSSTASGGSKGHKKEVNMMMEAKHKRVEKLTREMIAQFLENEGINTFRMRKEKLVNMVYEHFGDLE